MNTASLHISNPKSEIRNPKEVRNPKSEGGRGQATALLQGPECQIPASDLRPPTSAFALPISFGFRISDFGF